MSAIVGPIAPENNPPINPQYYQPSRFIITVLSYGIFTTVTTSVANNYVIGQLIRLLIPSGSGASILNEQLGYVTSINSPTQFVVGIDSSNASPLNLPHHLIATWQDVSFLPFYSIYIGGAWSNPVAFPGAGTIAEDVTSCLNPINKQIVVTWQDGSGLPFYSVYNGIFWSTAAQISSIASANSNIFTSFYPPTGQIIATWKDLATGFPFYSFFNGTSWTAGTAIPTATQVAVLADVYTSYNPTLQQIVATWQDSSIGDPYYSTYNGTIWTTGTAIIGADHLGTDNIFTSYNPVINATVAAFVEGVGFSAETWIYNGSWGSESSISNGGFAVTSDIYNSFNASIRQTLASADGSKLGGEYSFSPDGINWSQFTTFPSGASSSFNIFNCYSPSLQMSAATWNDSGTSTPFFSLFDGMNWSPEAPITNSTTNSDVFVTAILLTIPPTPNLGQVVAVGDINTGQINANGRNSNTTFINGSFINISPA